MNIAILFTRILNMSILASYCVLIVCAARLVLRKAPKKFSYLLWSIVGIRLICPLSFESVVSFIRISPKVIADSSAVSIQGNGTISAAYPTGGGSEAPAIDAAAASVERNLGMDYGALFLEAFSYVWLIGFAVLLFYSIYRYLKIASRLQSSHKASDQPLIYKAKWLGTPFVFGCLKPVIYLPEHLPEQEEQYVILHEAMHIRRKDHIIKLLAYLLMCLHWFNPCIWLAFYLMNHDMEMSCDEAVIRNLPDNGPKEYSLALLALAAPKTMYPLGLLAFGERSVKSRIKNVLSYRKPGLWISIGAVIVLIGLGAGLLSNPKTVDTEDPRIDSVADANFDKVQIWAEAFCNRDGNTLYELAADKEKFLEWDMVNVLEDSSNTIAFGYSSPWPWTATYLIWTDGMEATVLYYALVSDPAATVWIEKLKIKGEYLEHESLTAFDDITTAIQYNEAYLQEDSYCFFDFDGEGGFTRAIVYQLESGGVYGIDNTLYQNYQTAMELYLHVSGGTAQIDSLSDDSKYYWIEYTFVDGSTALCPMYVANEEWNVWTVGIPET